MLSRGMKCDLTPFGVIEVLNDLPSGGQSQAFRIQKTGGATYFLKLFLKPRLPNAGSPAVRARKEAAFRTFSDEKNRFYMAAGDAASSAPSLIRNYGLFQIDNALTTIFEFVDVYSPKLDGSGIPAFIREEPVEDRLALVLEVAEALNALHAKSIIHGDIKFDNVIFQRTKGDRKAGAGRMTIRPKLIDFCGGYFKNNPPTNGNHLPFHFDTNYAAPEVIEHGDSEMDDRTAAALGTHSDVFSFALLASQMVGSPVVESPASKLRDGHALKLNLDEIRDYPEVIRLIEAGISPSPSDRPTLHEFTLYMRGLGLTRAEVSREGFVGSATRRIAKLVLGPSRPQTPEQIKAEAERPSGVITARKDPSRKPLRTGPSGGRGAGGLRIGGTGGTKTPAGKVDERVPSLILPGAKPDSAGDTKPFGLILPDTDEKDGS